jgi:hypothetical protein
VLLDFVVHSSDFMKHGRKAIAIDLDPMSTFITKMTLRPVDLNEFKESFERIRKDVKTQIQSLYETKCPICGKNATALATIWSRSKNQPTEIRLYCNLQRYCSRER